MNEVGKRTQDCDDNEDMSNIEIGILTVIPEDSATIPYSLHLDATTTAILLEDDFSWPCRLRGGPRGGPAGWASGVVPGLGAP
ncbi:unnamed protein product [Leuciscus chuanchicus]